MRTWAEAIANKRAKKKSLSNTYFQEKVASLKKEIEETNRYPASFQYLPSNFYENSHNEVIRSQVCESVIIENGILSAHPSTIGVNSVNDKIKRSIDFGQIYIINAIGTTLYKIGISTDFKVRFKTLCAGSPLPLRVIKFARCDNPNLLEDKLHNDYAKCHFKNEWFNLTVDQLLDCISMIDKYYNIQDASTSGK